MGPQCLRAIELVSSAHVARLDVGPFCTQPLGAIFEAAQQQCDAREFLAEAVVEVIADALLFAIADFEDFTLDAVSEAYRERVREKFLELEPHG